MNKQEAKRLLRESLDRYRKFTYGELQNTIGDIETSQVSGGSGTQYQLEVQVFWDGINQQNIRVMASIDDGGWRAFAPLTDSIIMAPDGSFVGEG